MTFSEDYLWEQCEDIAADVSRLRFGGTYLPCVVVTAQLLEKEIELTAAGAGNYHSDAGWDFAGPDEIACFSAGAAFKHSEIKFWRRKCKLHKATDQEVWEHILKLGCMQPANIECRIFTGFSKTWRDGANWLIRNSVWIDKNQFPSPNPYVLVQQLRKYPEAARLLDLSNAMHLEAVMQLRYATPPVELSFSAKQLAMLL